MNAPTDERTEALLADVATGGVGADDPRVQAVLERSPGLARELDEIRDLASRLDEAARFRSEVLRDAASRADAPGLDRVRSLVREQVRHRRYRRGRRRGWVTLAAAAALVAAVLLGRSLVEFATDPAPGELHLGDSPIRLLPPDGGAAPAEEFAWTSSLVLPPGGYFLVWVFDATPGGDGRLLARSAETRDPTWNPTADESASWTSTIRWEVHAHDAAGTEIAVSGSRVRELR